MTTCWQQGRTARNASCWRWCSSADRSRKRKTRLLMVYTWHTLSSWSGRCPTHRQCTQWVHSTLHIQGHTLCTPQIPWTSTAGISSTRRCTCSWTQETVELPPRRRTYNYHTNCIHSSDRYGYNEHIPPYPSKPSKSSPNFHLHCHENPPTCCCHCWP